MSLRSATQSQSQYATAVLFTLDRTDREVTEAFASARSVTGHDPAIIEVVHDVVAPSRGAAARRGVNLVAAILDAAGLQGQFSIEHTLTTPLVATDEHASGTRPPRRIQNATSAGTLGRSSITSAPPKPAVTTRPAATAALRSSRSKRSN